VAGRDCSKLRVGVIVRVVGPGFATWLGVRVAGRFVSTGFLFFLLPALLISRHLSHFEARVINLLKIKPSGQIWRLFWGTNGRGTRTLRGCEGFAVILQTFFLKSTSSDLGVFSNAGTSLCPMHIGQRWLCEVESALISRPTAGSTHRCC